MTDRRELVERIAREHNIQIEWTAHRIDWSAYVDTRVARIPPPIDDTKLVVCLHELGHIVCGPCPGTAEHFDRVRVSNSCLRCEGLAWEQAKRWHPFTAEMITAMRQFFGSYRRIPAPTESQKKADVLLGRVSALEDLLRRKKFAEKVAQVQRWRKQR